uniref:Uncharacterized protein n=1 Tax=Chromera velia CCMP2878 TaxID=1169474 RepID=A0A0G4FJZ1_9ALVE|eukprot:Cvel_3434.t1-p1 / transcript=Cvel_3434.t1 / gene=Cvel_3434 / organism=Chromera_velia_CCMP2878 / gene_product=hypothetical protein / transcript_product=hypothetical protein / location=Cvel_scaffold138:60719-62982(+) / protein_length=383 / sequence_SO=supercontig / SO=protein_coding / is_pseudo=false
MDTTRVVPVTPVIPPQFFKYSKVEDWLQDVRFWAEDTASLDTLKGIYTTLRNAALGNNAVRDRLLEIRKSNPVPTISATNAKDEAKALKYNEDLRQWVTQTLIPEMRSREGVRETEEKDRVMMGILWFPSLANKEYSIFSNMMLFSQLFEFASGVQADGAVFYVGEGGDEEFFDCEETEEFFDCVSGNTEDCRAADFQGEGLIAEKARRSRPPLRIDLDSQCFFTLCFCGAVQGRIVREWPCVSCYREVWGQRATAQTTTRGIVRFHFRIPDSRVKGVLLLYNLSDDESVGCLVHCPELSRFDGTATLRDAHGNLVQISLDPSSDSPTYPFHASALGDRDEVASTGLDECEHKSSSALVTSALGCHGKEKEGGSTTTTRVPTK